MQDMIRGDSGTAARQQAKQRALLEVSRDESLSPSARMARMKEIMRTPVRGTAAAAAGRHATAVRPSPRAELEALCDRVRRRRIAGAVELPGRDLTDDDVRPLLDALEGCASVTRLDLRRNRIGAGGCAALVYAVLDNPHLVRIDVGGNALGDAGMAYLAKVLPHNATLVRLGLEDNGIGEEGAVALAGALAENGTLRHVDLGGNRLGDTGAAALFRTLGDTANACIVTDLGLGSNGIGDWGAKELASTLIDNETLVRVDLRENRIGNAGAEYLCKVLPANDTLEELLLERNARIHEGLIEDIRQALEPEDGSAGAHSGDGESGSEREHSDDEGSQSEHSDDEGSGSEHSEEEKSVIIKMERYVASEEEESESENNSREEHPNDDDGVELTGGEAMLKNMPDDDNIELTEGEAMLQNKHDEDNIELTGGEAMLQNMPDEDDRALAKRKAIQSVMQDRALSGPQRTKAIQDIMAGRVELPDVESKKVKPTLVKQPAHPNDDDGVELTVGEAMLKNMPDEDNIEVTEGEAMPKNMPDEDNRALAKRKAIKSVMQDRSLSGSQRTKKIRDIIASRVELPDVESKKEKPTALGKRRAMHQVMKDGSLSAPERSKKIHDIMAGRVELSPPPKKAAAATAEGGNAEEGLRDNAMLTDVLDKTKAALEKRRAMHQVMKDGSLSALERSKKIQDIMAGRVKLPSPPKKATAALLPTAETDAAAAEGDSAEEREGVSAMLTEVSDETDAALRKRKAMQQVMKDVLLSAPEKFKKIQDIMAGRAELSPPPKKARAALLSAAESAAAAAEGDRAEEGLRANAMLTDVPDETDAALRKRRAMQQVMKDGSLSAPERFKKMQDIMSGRVQL